MATKVAIATISNLFRDANYGPIFESAYYLWERTFRNVSDEDLEQGAWNLIRNRDEYRRGQVRLDEITRELADMGIRVYQRKVDPAFEHQFPEDNNEGAVSLAKFCEMEGKVGRGLRAFLKGGNNEAPTS